MEKIFVSKNNNDSFNTIGEALFFAKDFAEVEIHIENGVYYEKLNISHDNIKFIGESVESTIIYYDDYALKIHDDGEKYGTFRTYTINATSEHIEFSNLTIKNTAGKGDDVGQAVCLSLCAKNVKIINCKILAHQDTIFMSPFPPSPILQNGFKGEHDKTPTLLHKNYFENCYISGDIDFIFGGGVAFFEKCTIYSNDLGKDTNGYITAPSTPEGFPYGFVFNECDFISDAKEDSVYLSRPWRIYAKTVFIKCNFGKHIKKVGYSDWDKKESHDTTFFAEYLCEGDGSSLENRESFAKVLTENEAKEYTKENVLKW